MSCMCCGALSFSPNISPFGCYFCVNEHAQCETCNRKCRERCSICSAPTEFVEMVKSKSPERKTASTFNQSFIQNEECEPKLAIIEEEQEASVSSDDQRVASDAGRSTISGEQTWRSLKSRLDDDLGGEEGWRRQKMGRRLHTKKLEVSFLEMSKSLEDLGVLHKLASGVIFTANKSKRRRSQSLSGDFPFEPHQKHHCADEKKFSAHERERDIEPTERRASPMRIQAGEQLQSIVDSENQAEVLKMQMKDRMYHIVELERMRKLLELESESEKSELLRLHKEQHKRLMHEGDQRGKDFKKNESDERMEKIFKTLKEEPREPLVIAESELKTLRTEKMHFEHDPKTADVSYTREASKQDAEQDKPKKGSLLASAERYLSRVRRALCVPFKMTLTSATNCAGAITYRLAPPAAQSMPIPASEYDIESTLKSIKRKIDNEQRNPLPITREPIKCPDADCHKIVFISDLNTHFIQDHATTSIERIACGQVKTFFLDPRLSRDGEAKSHMIYLVTDKNVHLGESEYDHMLPMLVMSCRVHLLDLCGYQCNNIDEQKKSSPTDEILLIWLTGLLPECNSISATIAVWPLESDNAENHTVHSSNIYSIRSSHNMRDIYNSNCAMYLTWPMVQHMTNNGVQMIGVQIVVN